MMLIHHGSVTIFAKFILSICARILAHQLLPQIDGTDGTQCSCTSPEGVGQVKLLSFIHVVHLGLN